jgi:hypothetical protein
MKMLSTAIQTSIPSGLASMFLAGSPRLGVSDLRLFKEELSDENRFIAVAVSGLLPPAAGGVILDVGAGLGDIARRAFPDRKAILLDILDFPPTHVAQHRRVHCDFFDYQHPESEPIDLLLLSHVTQYLDDDLDRLHHQLTALDPAYIMTVLNDDSGLYGQAIRWFNESGITSNPENPRLNIVPQTYVEERSLGLEGKLQCREFRSLADQLGRVVLDAELDDDMLDEFTRWLQVNSKTPMIEISQRVTRYTRLK